MRVEIFHDTTGATEAGAFAQSAPYAVAAATLGAGVRRVCVYDGATPLASAQILTRRGIGLISRGPVWHSDLAVTNRKPVLRRIARHCGLLLATPDSPLAGFGLMPLVTSQTLALWDLTPDPNAIRAQTHVKWRNRLTASERRGIGITRGGRATLDHLILAEGAQRRSRGYRAPGPDFTRALPPDALRLWHWGQRGQTHAAMCFVRHGAWATYHLGHADAQARAVGAHGVMLWHAALALRAEGVRMLDLGQIETETAPGLARFKLGTGAALHLLGATCAVLPA